MSTRTARLLTILPTLLVFVFSVKAGDPERPYRLPMDLAPVLSANFGELRENHFHSGVDFKTQGVVGHAVRSVADGCVSRIGVRKYGYGKAVYIDHPDGHTSVYAHLDRLSPRLERVLRDSQYRAESYQVDLYFADGQLPVQQGELIAYSGNTGGSGGPHLHFEIRDTESEDILDPLWWFASRISDREAPRILALAFYQEDGKRIIPVKDNRLQEEPPAFWGKLGLGLKAYDYMSGTRNLYGVQLIRLFLDDKEIFRQDISRFSFADSRYINYICDYEEWVLRRQWIMKSFYPRSGYGVVDINEERPYRFRYELSDRYGNCCSLSFVVYGERAGAAANAAAAAAGTAAARPLPGPARPLPAIYPHTLVYPQAIIHLPLGSLYSDCAFSYSIEPASRREAARACSPVYRLHQACTPLHRKINIALKIEQDRLENKKQYYLAYRNRKQAWEYIEANYNEGWMSAQTTRLGDYMVLVDTIVPKISMGNIVHDLKNDLIRIHIKDTESDLAHYQVYIDGHWALFEDDYKNDAIFYRIDGQALQRTGQQHRMTVQVWDHCGNMAEKEISFIY